MSTVQLNAVGFGYIDQENPYTHYTIDNNTWYKITGFESSLNAKLFLWKFDEFPQNLRHYDLLGVQIMVASKSEGSISYSNTGFICPVIDAFDPATVTWANFTGYDGGNIGVLSNNHNEQAADELVPDSISGYWANRNRAKLVASNSCACIYNNESDTRDFILVRPNLVGGGLSYAVITYDELRKQTSQVAYRSGAKSGYLNPRNSATFSWKYIPVTSNIVCADDSFTQDHATFYWKKSTDQSYTAVAVSGSTTSVTIAANTFPTASTIQWYVEGTDEDNTTTQTDIFSFSTAASLIDTVCKRPVNSVEDGSAPIEFVWEFWSNDGYPASRTEVYWKKCTDESWTTLLDEASTVTSITVAGGTFPAGGIDWKVVATNIDGVTGGSVGTASFISVAAPDEPSGLAATEVPLTTISWQSSEQQAYEISVDGVVIQKAFGNASSWTVSEPLSEGTHLISVRVQGQYGFWSQPSEITVTIGGPESTFSLTGDFGCDAELASDVTDPDDVVRFYRDGVFIGTAIGNDVIPATYTDRLVLGTHSYYARIFKNDGNYEQSNSVTGTMFTNVTKIAEINPDGTMNGGWLDLTYSINSDDVQSFDWSRTASFRHVGGARFPDLELSHYEALSASYDCAFADETSCKRFENLKGKLVVLKSRRGNVVTGALLQINKREMGFFTSYVFMIQQIHLEGSPDA